MTMQPDRTLTPLGELCAEVFLRRLHEQGFRSSTRLIVDALPREVGEQLFAALLELGDTQVSVRVPRDDDGVEEVPLVALSKHAYDIVPFLVDDVRTPVTAGPRRNRGSEGFASCLRDHYAVDADRPRLLVVVTSKGNETQQSARDVLADKALVTLDLLLVLLLERAGLPPRSPLHTVAAVYLHHQRDEARWQRIVEDFESYVNTVADLPPEEQGARLPMLGCFLPDASPRFADGERVRILEDKDQRRRQRGDGRLYDNALLREFLTEAFDNPIADAEHVLAEVFEDQPETARSIARGGRAGLDALDVSAFAEMEQKRQRRQKNAFDRATLRVEGAACERVLGQGDDSVLVVSADRPFTVAVQLARPLKERREHVQLVTWNAQKRSPAARPLPAVENATEVLFPLDPPPQGGFAVFRLALTRGPRSLANPIDALLVAVYGAKAPEVVVEEGRRLSLEHQAWIAEGGCRFHRYSEAGSEPIDVLGEDVGESGRNEDEQSVRVVRLVGSLLQPRVVDDEEPVGPDETDDGRFAYETLLELACYTHKLGHRTAQAVRSAAPYLAAVSEISEGPQRFKVDLPGGVNREIWPARGEREEPFLYERAVAHLLRHPVALRLERRQGQWSACVFDASGSRDTLCSFLDARRAALEGVGRLAERSLPRFRRGVEDSSVPVSLLPLEEIRPEIEAMLAAWRRAVDDVVSPGAHYSSEHDALLQTDTLRLLDGRGALERLVVLPTHPWMLAAALYFQDIFGRNLKSAEEKKVGQPTWRFELQREEVMQLVPRTAVEDWYLWQTGASRLLLTDSAPFHLEFLPESSHVHRSTLDYVVRVVANKIGRYLRMHPHLRDERRTLRVGFVNPGDGSHLLEGLHQWLRNVMREHADRLRILPMEQIPAIDVFLFAPNEASADEGAAFERFFRDQVSASDEDVIRQALLARLQFRFCAGAGPSSNHDAVHICFVHGLVDIRRQSGKTGLLNEWWDGGFGEGMLATYLRRTLPGSAGQRLHSRRGLWIDPASDGLRGALARLLSLHRGCRDSDLAVEKGLYWECALPNIGELADTYRYSDWIVHLDRELSLELFRRGETDESPTIIEYSDQEVPESPGYDTITVTRHATPYREQLGEILTTADLDVAGRGEEARRAANAILDDINVLSGSWALDFLLGSIADERTSMRLKGNVGAALVYRWLRRMEHAPYGGSILDTNVGQVLPVFVSLEDLLRATPAAGLSRREGLVYRYTNEVEDNENQGAMQWCDDLLVLYLTPSRAGQPSQLYGRVIEVKFGRGATGAKEKAVAQVRSTRNLLQERLAGEGHPLDAPFRHKQLSLLIKAQLEQAVAMGALSPEVYAFLNVPVLSANLATGRYSVDYMLDLGDRQALGDAFLLHTASTAGERVRVEVVDDVRVVTIPRPLVEWLAFEPGDSPTLSEEPLSTLPWLGCPVAVEPESSSTAGSEVGLELEAPPASAPEVETAPEGQALSETETPQWLAVQPTEGLAAPSLDDACSRPIKDAPYAESAIGGAIERLERALVGHRVRLASAPSPQETDRGPRLVRAYVRLDAGESINAVRRISEDIARVVGTSTSDIHITNVPERHAVGLDLPLAGLSYSIGFDEVLAHPSFDAARRELALGICAGIDVTGRPVWVDLARMPHMLVAGTTGSGKTVFLRNIVLTLLMHRSPGELVLRFSSSKPMDFRIFTQVPHAHGRDMAQDVADASRLAHELVEEMDRRIELITDAWCDNLVEFNREKPDRALPFIVAVFDEYAEMVASFTEKSERDAFESAIGRLAQKARAAGIHLVICMQRPDANALKGAIKANILHRFALKLPQNQDSRIILDENGAETLLGQGDLLYKDANSRVFRLQVPLLDNAALKENLKRIVEHRHVLN